MLVGLADEPGFTRVGFEHHAKVYEVPGELAVQLAVGNAPIPIIGRDLRREMDTEHRGRSSEGVFDSCCREYAPEQILYL